MMTTEEKQVENPKVDDSIIEDENKPSEDEEDVITIGDEDAPPPEEKAPDWVRKVRQDNREIKKENRDLRKQLESQGSVDQTAGPKPTLEGCDYDNAQFEQKLIAWHEKKAEADRKQVAEDAEQARQNADWQKNLDDYGEKKAALNVHDFEDAEEIAKETLSQTQQGIIVAAAENSAVVMYALGKNPKRAKELAAIKNPVKFTAAMAKLEAQMKITKRKPSAQPEGVVKNSGGASIQTTGSDSELDRLREEAKESGDYSKVHAYKKQMSTQK